MQKVWKTRINEKHPLKSQWPFIAELFDDEGKVASKKQYGLHSNGKIKMAKRLEKETFLGIVFAHKKMVEAGSTRKTSNFSQNQGFLEEAFERAKKAFKEGAVDTVFCPGGEIYLSRYL